MTLFDNLERTERRPKRYGEPIFEYWNTSDRPSVTANRALLERWFARFPEPCRPDLRARFRSGTDSQHLSAFWELYLHELLCSMGFTVRCHPPAGEELGTHPDFLVSLNGARLFYLEGTLALPSQAESAEEARTAQVYDAINKMNSPNFFLGLRIRGAPATPPAGARLRPKLERWLSTLDPDDVGGTLEKGGLHALPTFPWSHQGWDVIFYPLPKSPEKRGKPGVRPIGLTMPGARYVDVHTSVRSSVAGKATKYGNLDLPFIVAVNVLDEFADLHLVLDGLLGQECVVVTERRDGSSEHRIDRTPDGAWFGARGSQNTRVSAAFVGLRLSVWDIAENTPDLVHNPWASRPMPQELWSMPQLVPNMQLRRLEKKIGRSAGQILSVPTPWPVPD
jgi:hypothetical protein